MDKKTFFSALSDEAAVPDVQFINNLRTQVISLAGTPPPATGTNLLRSPKLLLIAAGVSVSIIVGVMTQQTVPNNANNVALTQSEQTNEQQSTQTDTQEKSTSNGALATEDEVQPTADELAQSSTEGQSDGTTPQQSSDTAIITPEDSAASTPADVAFTVSFWDLTASTKPPAMQDGSPDYTETVSELNYFWGAGSPSVDIIGEDYFVLRAEGAKYLEAGEYRLTVGADDGVRVYLDGELVVDRWTNSIGESSLVDFTVDESALMPITVEYFEKTLNAQLDLNITPR